MSERGKKIAVVVLFAALLGLILFLRAPVFSDTFCDPDQGSPAYAARILLSGQCFYSQAHISKPPGSTVLYAVLFRLFGVNMTVVHILAALTIWLSAVLLFGIGKRIAGLAAGVVAASIYAFYQADIASSGICANFESWSILPAVACLAMVIGEKYSRGKLLGAGSLAALTVWMKQPAIFFALAALLVVMQLARRREPRTLSSTRCVLWFFGGGLLLSMPLLLMMAAVDCLGPMWTWLNPLTLRKYLGTVAPDERWELAGYQLGRWFASNAGLWVFLALSFVVAPRVIALRSLRRPWFAAALFLAAAFAFMLAGGRFYGHYLVVALPFACLWIGLIAGVVVAGSNKRAFAVLIVLVLIGGTFVDSWPELRLAGQSLHSRMTGGPPISAAMHARNRRAQIEPGRYANLVFHLEWQDTYRQIASALRARLMPGRAVWCYDYMPEMYHYLRVFAPTKHQEHFEIVTAASDPHHGLWFEQENEIVRKNRVQLLTDLATDPPQFILRLTHPCVTADVERDRAAPTWPRNSYGEQMTICLSKAASFPALDKFLDEHYRLVEPPLNNAVSVYEWREE